MNIFQRISKLISANINHMLDTAEDPEVMIKQLIREMEEGIIELRRETVKAIGQKKQLEKKIHMARGQSAVLENKATLALEGGDEEFARTVLATKLDTEARINSLENELHLAAELAEKMKSDLSKLEDQVQSARRKKEELVRRKLAADAQMRTHQALQKSHQAMSAISGSISDIDNHTSAIESYKDQIMQLEAEAEASEELLKLETAGSEKEIELDKKLKQKAVDDELAKLKQKLSGKKS
jgi:phage shock protein A